jgi:hypothetical protein
MHAKPATNISTELMTRLPKKVINIDKTRLKTSGIFAFFKGKNVERKPC